MAFYDKLVSGIPTISFEIFPPKNPAGWGALYSTLGEIAKQSPDFVSVTYGAGGSTRAKTVDLVGRIQTELAIESIAHLTCIGHSQNELDDIFMTLNSAGIGSIMALRGGEPGAPFVAHPEGFTHAAEMIGFARSRYSFHLGCAFYPEKHPEAPSLEEDIRHLKEKQDAGADFAVSQLFFDNDQLYRFRDLANAAGVTLPLIAGIMPLIKVGQFQRIEQLSGTKIPAKLLEYLGDATDDETVGRKGVEFGIGQCRDLLDNGIAGIHLYTLNKSGSSAKITRSLRDAGYFSKTR